MKKKINQDVIKKNFKAAIALTVVAIGDGYLMIRQFDPFMVLAEMVLVGCAVGQWVIYSNIKMHYDIQNGNISIEEN